MLDILTTATLRPDILERTLSTFCANLLDDFISPSECRHVMNIDRVGDACEPEELIAIAKKYFPNTLHRISDEPSFPKAFIWCWAQIKSDYFFWLEDDWEFTSYVNLSEMRYIMEQEPDLALLRLPRWEATAMCRQWNRMLDMYNGYYFQIPHELKGTIGFSGNPSLINSGFAEQILPHIVTDICPERQIKGRRTVMSGILNRWEYGIYQHPYEKHVVMDIGQAWRKKRRLAKDSRLMFRTWKNDD